MKYIKISNLDYSNTFFHFTRIDNRDSIARNGLCAVPGGENKAGEDYKNPTIYFAYGIEGMLKAIDVWIKWEYNRLRHKEKFEESPSVKISEKIMKETYQKIYDDFKNRNYYKLDLIEGENPETSDFSFNGIDKKKELEYSKFKKEMEKFEKGETFFKPCYPNKDMKWMYGEYSDFSNGNIKQDNWNMNTHIGNKIIPASKIKIIEAENGRTDALSIAFEIYEKNKEKLANIDLSRLDDFIKYAKERYKNDKDFAENTEDFGRRSVNPSEERKYQFINKISIQMLGKQVIQELSDTILLDETENILVNQEKQIKQQKDSKNQTFYIE